MVPTTSLVVGFLMICVCSSCFEIVRTRWPASNKTVIMALLPNFAAREIIDKRISEDYGYDPNKLLEVPWSKIACYQVGAPIEYVAKGTTYDDLMNNMIALIKAVQPLTFSEISLYGRWKEFWDASVVPWNGRLLLVSNCYARGILMFAWLNMSTNPTSSPYLGLSAIPSALNFPVSGEDPRVMVVNGSFMYVVYSFGKPMRMRIMEVGLDSGGRLAILKNSLSIELESVVNAHIENAAVQKNWSPFLHNQTLHFIQRLNPFTVVSIDPHFENNTIPLAKVVSMANYIDLPWKLGVLRGGTNHVQISPDEYLGIFHTTSNIPRRTASRWFATYFMGAYTFSTSPPFELLRISPVPIVKDSFYLGPWYAKYIDYCVFPSSLYVDNEFAVISLTLQNVDSYIAKIRMTELLESLQSVHPDQRNAKTC